MGDIFMFSEIMFIFIHIEIRGWNRWSDCTVR